MSACTQSGSNYVIQRTYNDCSLGGGQVTLSGSSSFTYSAAGCSMIGVTNRSVTRTVNLSSSSTGRLGSSLSISSENATDYRGNTIGGGQTLTVNAAAGAFSFSVGGVTRKLTTGAGRTLFSIATRTTEPFSASGSSLSSLIVSGGSLEVIHNQAQYVLTLSASNVSFSASCTCPVSGVMSGAFSGSVSGTATITYTGCGTADVTTSDGATTAVTLDSCGA